MLKVFASFVLDSEASLTYPWGQSRSWPAQGWAGEYRTPPALPSSAATLDGHFEHPEDVTAMAENGPD